MIDFKQWIYSQDMAAWFSQRDSFSVGAQMDCICCAPHRTIDEKMEGLRQLYDESGEEIVLDRIKSLESLQCQNRQEVPEEARLFQAEVFCQGEQEPVFPMIFQTAGQAVDEIRLRIQELSAQCELEREQYYGIIKVFHKTDSADRFLHEENLATRHDGEVLFALSPDYRKYVRLPIVESGAKEAPFIGSEEIAWKIPYSSGTLVAVEKNPFFPSTKGVLVNIAEPGEAGFAGDRYNQWLLCAEPTYTEQTHGINAIIYWMIMCRFHAIRN